MKEKVISFRAQFGVRAGSPRSADRSKKYHFIDVAYTSTEKTASGSIISAMKSFVGALTEQECESLMYINDIRIGN